MVVPGIVRYMERSAHSSEDNWAHRNSVAINTTA
jgi:hypothetical protein